MPDTGIADRSADAAAVLIVADDAEFAHTVTSRWQSERRVPAFTLVSGDLCPAIDPAAFDLAIVGAVRAGVLPSALTILESTAKPVVFVAFDAQASENVRETHTRTLVLRQHEGWLDALVLLATESLRCAHALARARNAEQAARDAERQATLGRYMLDMRHTLNNALTSVLGNSELLLLEPGVLSAQAREQIDTVRNMAFRMHEVLQRFSSLENELRCVEKQTAQENRTKENPTKVWGAAAST
jgi:signal transduction histidine kinase